jgi:hypothetical protein
MEVAVTVIACSSHIMFPRDVIDRQCDIILAAMIGCVALNNMKLVLRF